MLTSARCHAYAKCLPARGVRAIIRAGQQGRLAMSNVDVLFESSVPGLPLLGRGKVRDIYGVDDDHLLIVTTDRLSG